VNADRYLYNDEPVIEEGSWKLLAPTKWAVKWKHLSSAPIVVHNCPNDEEWRIDTVVSPENMKGAPRCGLCSEDIPEGIQAVWQLSHMEEMLG
jgi:hypothetical protein